LSIQTISFEKPIDSSNMNPKKWIEIASIIEENYSNFDGFVVLHGSDTMSYSASALSFMLENLTKPVVLLVRNCQ
jgi:L-asparaginase